MALVAILVKDNDETGGVDVDIRGDRPMEDGDEFTPAQTLALLMANAAFQELLPDESED